MKRRLLKTATWRLIATATTLIIAYVITGDHLQSLGITIGANAVKTFGYYIHEWAWEKVK